MFGLGLAAPAASGAEAVFSAASNDGSRVFFTTDEQLVSGDTDGAIDVYQRSGGATTRVSQGGTNGNGNFDARFLRASSNGSRVFFSTSERLVGGDIDNRGDIYQRAGGTTTWVSRGQINGNGPFNPAFRGASNDGSRVFFSTDEKLASGDTDGEYDVYERSGGTTTRVSRGGINGNGPFDAYFRGASSDGLKVFFDTAEKLASGDTDSGYYDSYQRSGGTTTWISQGEINGNLDGYGSTLLGSSSDGSKVFFWTDEQLVSGDTDSSLDIYERSAGTTTWISQGEINGNGNVDARFIRASNNGSKVFFGTGERLASGDTDSATDIWERSGGTTIRVSQGEINGNGHFAPSFRGIASNGFKVFFWTSEQLVSGDTDGAIDVYQRSGGTTTWISQGEINGNGASHSSFSVASSDGSRVFFTTQEKLVSGDTDSSLDVYERFGGTTTRVSRGQINGNGEFAARFAGASSDGSKVFFQTDEPLVSGDTDAMTDIYQRSAGTTTMVSAGT